MENPIRRALVSVFDKDGVLALARDRADALRERAAAALAAARDARPSSVRQQAPPSTSRAP